MKDRELQKNILVQAQKAHPEAISPQTVAHCYWDIYPKTDEDNGDDQDVMFIAEQRKRMRLLFSALKYLEEHKLITVCEYNGVIAPAVTITALGIDFLADDGGLSAILNTVTVKFDMDNVRELVEGGLFRAGVPEEKHSALKEAIREAPGTMLQTAVSKMVENGMSDPAGTAKTVAGLFGITW